MAKNSVLAGAIKRFDFKMLLNPLIEQLNLPTLPVELGDSKSVELSIIGYEPVKATLVEKSSYTTILKGSGYSLEDL